MDYKQRRTVFFIGTFILVVFLAFLIIRGDGKSEAKDDTVKNPVGQSANGPDAQASESANPEPTPTGNPTAIPTDNINEAPDSALSNEDQEAAMKVIIDGATAYYTVYSSESTQQYHARVDPFFVPGTAALNDIPAIEDDNDAGQTGKVLYDSGVVLNYANPYSADGNTLGATVSLDVKNQITDTTEANQLPQVYQEVKYLDVTVTRGSDGIWRINDLNES